MNRKWPQMQSRATPRARPLDLPNIGLISGKWPQWICCEC
jgi:hypothetical protein